MVAYQYKINYINLTCFNTIIIMKTANNASVDQNDAECVKCQISSSSIMVQSRELVKELTCIYAY